MIALRSLKQSPSSWGFFSPSRWKERQDSQEDKVLLRNTRLVFSNHGCGKPPCPPPSLSPRKKVDFAAFQGAQTEVGQGGLCFRELLWASLCGPSSPADWVHPLILPTYCPFTHLLPPNTHHSLTHSAPLPLLSSFSSFFFFVSTSQYMLLCFFLHPRCTVLEILQIIARSIRRNFKNETFMRSALV